ncbi:WXG100 family type VII secretion target [Actinoplanes sp. N902-109]|uniref:WXG100 family type VII secretion target n=1 Tax=Actinoplanes sp. (strain N902-109) TaxID=649831 RepID=UPI0003294B75|nr:hypothetical protein [Actinoplanes sp. N902-109]AGL14096.1 hypothetical protein L083_0586 [Actinoplanes sp. N902-109]
MSQPHGRLWVNPEGVVRVGDAYSQHVDIYQRYLDQLTSLRQRYADSWGDDDMGNQFSQKFLGGMDNLEKLVGGIKGTLDYTAKGLQESGKLYRQVDDEAGEAGHKMARDFETNLPTGQAHAPLARTEATVTEAAPMKPLLREATPLLAEEHGVRRLAMRAEERPLQPTEQGTLRPMLREAVRSVDPNDPEPVRSVREPLQREVVRSVNPNDPEPVRSVREPLQPTFSVSRAMPAISSYMSKPEYATAYVGGEPLPQGYRLEALNPFEDGSTRVDANLYDSITPLAGTPVTTPDGRPIDPEGRQFFVVKQNPTVDPTTPGYEPLLLSYAPDGTPTPLIPGQ